MATSAEIQAGVAAADAAAIKLIQAEVPSFFQSEAQQAMTKYMPFIVQAAISAVDKMRAAAKP